MQKPDDFQLHAWIDESMRSESAAEPMYLLGAVIADPQQCDETRRQLKTIQPKGAPKLHWRQMKPAEKTLATTVISAFDLAHLVVIATPLDRRKQERARAACMERLLWELGQLGVSHAILEQRTQSLNDRDMQLIRRLRGKRAIPSSLRVEVGQPSTEPMLWVPDQVLGAVGDDRTGQGRWIDLYSQPIEQIAITL